ncbi:hypothetical protein R3W88_033268 [Solanum pinnatisectum]|uniref:RNase H type-1 domain-containing protein n=1 Tax=Solanum pinnatisectum TaxID=50273 RepID=A0AAV9K1C9_9SOLN|nr:hypothetical protein R3W88_033268 [Solanum pinnatisectum]
MSQQSMIMEVNRNLFLMAKWTRPGMGVYKCNTDGSSKDNLNISTTAFCVRNDRGELVVAQARKLDICTALEAEVQAFKEGLTYCLNHHYIPLIMETDSLIIKKILDGIWEVPWNISGEIRALKRDLKFIDATVVHTYREGNKLADFLSNVVANVAGPQLIQFNNFQELPIQTKTIMNMDKASTPNFRTKKGQNNNTDTSHRD